MTALFLALLLTSTQELQSWTVISGAEDRFFLPKGQYACIKGKPKKTIRLSGRHITLRLVKEKGCAQPTEQQLYNSSLSAAPRVVLDAQGPPRLRVYLEALSRSAFFRQASQVSISGRVQPGEWTGCESTHCDYLFKDGSLRLLRSNAKLTFTQDLEGSGYLLSDGRPPGPNAPLSLGVIKRFDISARLSAIQLDVTEAELSKRRFSRLIDHPLAQLLLEVRAFSCDGASLDPRCIELPYLSDPDPHRFWIQIGAQLEKFGLAQRRFRLMIPFQKRVEVYRENERLEGLQIHFTTQRCIYSWSQLSRAYAGFERQEVAFSVVLENGDHCASQPWRARSQDPRLILSKEVRRLPSKNIAILEILGSRSVSSTVRVPLRVHTQDEAPVAFTRPLELTLNPVEAPKIAQHQVELKDRFVRLSHLPNKLSAGRKNRITFLRRPAGLEIVPEPAHLFERCELGRRDSICVRPKYADPSARLTLRVHPQKTGQLAPGTMLLKTQLFPIAMNFAIDIPSHATIECGARPLFGLTTALTERDLTRCALRFNKSVRHGTQRLEVLIERQIQDRFHSMISPIPIDLLDSDAVPKGGLEFALPLGQESLEEVPEYSEVRFTVRHRSAGNYVDQEGISNPSTQLIARARKLPRGHFWVNKSGVGMRTFVTAVTGAAYRIPSGVKRAVRSTEFSKIAPGQLKAGAMLVLEPWRFAENRPWWYLNPQLHIGLMALNAAPEGVELPSAVIGLGLRIPGAPTTSALDTDTSLVAWWEISKGPRGVQGSLVLGVGLRFGRWLP